MFIAGVFERIEDLHGQQNNVTDRGFLSLAKVTRAPSPYVSLYLGPI
jgi:hypothetical protein